MSALGVAAIAFACLFGGALIGMWIRNALPAHHLSDDSRHLLGMGMGVIGTMSGLVLGLLVARESIRRPLALWPSGIVQLRSTRCAKRWLISTGKGRKTLGLHFRDTAPCA